MITAVKIIIALALFGCLLKVPYGYFQFVRITSFIGFLWLCYNELEARKSITGILCLAGAILLNPIIKIHFTRNIWNNIDTALGISLWVWIIADIAKILTKRK